MSSFTAIFSKLRLQVGKVFTFFLSFLSQNRCFVIPKVYLSPFPHKTKQFWKQFSQTYNKETLLFKETLLNKVENILGK